MTSNRILASLCLLAAFTTSSAGATTPCPSGVFFAPKATGSSVDAGWTGLSHDMPAIGYAFRMGMSCGPSTPPCGTCSITGLLPNAGGNNQRCTNDTSIICTAATEVADCGAPGRCHFFAGPPTPVSTGGVSSCYTSEITGPVSGSVNVDTGALSPDVPFQATLFLGIDVDHPCPRCLGDLSPNDNVRGGTCSNGPRISLPCDVNAVAEYPDFGAVSFDCPPNPGSQIAQFILGTVGFSTEAQSRTLNATSPSCTHFAFSSEKCFCDTCNNVAQEVCQSNADCPDPAGPIGPICGGKRCLGGSNAGAACTAASACPDGGLCARPGVSSQPHSCLDNTITPGPACVDTAPVDGEGECGDGPIDNSCSVASGHPQRGCVNDADCGGLVDSCETTYRKCYLDQGAIGGSISVTGVATPPVGNTSDPTSLGVLSCLAPTAALSVNSVGGFPGLARGFYPGRMTFAEEIVVDVVPPGGTITTAGSGPASVAETSVTTPTGGEVTLIGTFNTGAPPSGYEFLGRLVQITALPATAASPLQISFDIAASEVPVGQDESTIALFRNGTGPIPNCLGATQAIPDDPCITARTALGGGDVRLTVLTSAASDWMMATVAPFCPLAPASCRNPFSGGRAQIQLTDRSPDDKDQLAWKWLAGSATTKLEFGDPLGADDYGLCLYDDTNGLRASLLAPFGGICAGKPCWADKPTGFAYKDKDLTPFGLAQIVLKAGADGKAQIQVKGKGRDLPMPSLLSVVPPLTVQLRNLTSGLCWSATYSAPTTRVDGTQLKGKAD